MLIALVSLIVWWSLQVVLDEWKAVLEAASLPNLTTLQIEDIP